MFESRFLPKALLVFVVEDEKADARRRRRSSTRRAAATSRATGSSGRPRSSNVTHNRTGLSLGGGGGLMTNHDLLIAVEHDLGRRHGGARDVHAGRLRVPRGGPDADEERRAHRRQERPDLRDRLARLLRGRLRDRLRRRQLLRRHAAASSPRSTSCSRSARRRSAGSPTIPGGRRLPVRGRLRGRLARDRLGRDGRAGEALGLLRLRRLLHADLLGRLALDLEPGRLAVRARGCRTSPARRSSTTRARSRRSPGRSCSARASASSATTGARTRSPATTCPYAVLGDAHPLVRLVRLQPGLDAVGRLRRRSATSPTSR